MLWVWAVNWLSAEAPKIRRAELKLLTTSTVVQTFATPSKQASILLVLYPPHHDQVEQTRAQDSDPLLKITLAFLRSGKEVGRRGKEVDLGVKVEITSN